MPAILSAEFEADEARFASLATGADFQFEDGRLGGVTSTSGGPVEAVFQIVVVFLQGVAVARAAADVARAAKWLAGKYGDVRVDESGIHLLARRDLESRGGRSRRYARRNRAHARRQEVHRGVPARIRAVALMIFHFDSTLMLYEEMLE